jgi:hypothetical protein
VTRLYVQLLGFSTFCVPTDWNWPVIPRYSHLMRGILSKAINRSFKFEFGGSNIALHFLSLHKLKQKSHKHEEQDHMRQFDFPDCSKKGKRNAPELDHVHVCSPT